MLAARHDDDDDLYKRFLAVDVECLGIINPKLIIHQ